MKRIHPIEKAIYIYFIGAFVLLCILSYLSHRKDAPATKVFKYSGYETDDTSYYNGQLLFPDMIHQDTLVVVDAKQLNECIASPYVASDGDLIEILNETTQKYKPFSHED